MNLTGIAVAATLLLAAGLGVEGQGEFPEVTIPGLGAVMGGTEKSWTEDRTFYKFLGIPFAEPPLGPLRFQPPQLPIPWSPEVLNATSVGRRCPQARAALSNETWQELMGEEEGLPDEGEEPEDCLFIQIYTPTLDPDARLPVMIFFYGGAFRFGSAHGYGASKFMDKDVVLVLPHYRLGPLGFLSLHTDAIPGNAAMLDQVAAIQWVKDHISVFGGDPDEITVFGESAGGISSSLLAISPLSSGLFKRYISESGSAAAIWTIDWDPIPAATEIGRLSGCPTAPLQELTDCLFAVNSSVLMRAHNEYQMAELKAGRPFFGGSGPVIQQAGSVRFLEKPPREIMEQGDYVTKPALLGSNKHEGTLIYAWVYRYFLEPNGLVNDTQFYERNCTNMLLSFFQVGDSGEVMAAAVEKAYFGLENMGNHTAMVPGFVDFLGALTLKGIVYDQANYNAKFATTYKYSYNYEGRTSLWFLTGEPGLLPGGVAHANELLMLFDFPVLILSAEERALSRKMVTMWTNFAIYGNPTPPENPVEDMPVWEPFTLEEGFYLRIDHNSSIMQDYPTNEYFVARDEGFPW